VFRSGAKHRTGHGAGRVLPGRRIRPAGM